MNCQKCGTPLTQNDQFCKGCGTPNPMVQPANNFANQSTPQNTFTNQNANDMNSQMQPQMNMQQQMPMGNIHQMAPTPAPQPMPNFNNQPIEPPKPKKDNTLILIIIGIIVMVAAIAGAVYVGHTIGKKAAYDVKNNDNTANEKKEEATYKVKFAGFSMNLPTNVTYTIKGEYLHVKDNETNIITQIAFDNSDLELYKENIEELKDMYQENGYTETKIEVKSVNNIELILIELESTGKYTTILSKASLGYVVGISILDISNESSTDEKLEFATKIISSLKYVGETSNMEVESEFPPFPTIKNQQ